MTASRAVVRQAARVLRRLGAADKRRGLLFVALAAYLARWYGSLHEEIRLRHRADGKRHPVLDAWKNTSVTLREGYRPPAWMSLGSRFLVGSLHTVFHNILRRSRPVPEVHYERELFELDCGGTVGLDWAVSVGDLKAPARDDTSKPLIFMHHGLAGCSKSHYIQSFIARALATGEYRVCVMVARGCGGVPLTTPYGFTAAGFSDMGQAIESLKTRNPNTHIFGVGYSLGAGLLANYLGRSGRDCKLSGAVVLSPCWDFHRTTPYFEIWSRKFLAASLKFYTEQNKEIIASNESIDLHKALAAVNVREFDQHAVVPVHGYDSVDDYYYHSSPINHAHEIHVPTLAFSADDDPVCSIEGADIMEEKGMFGPGLLVARTNRGGHVSWAEGAVGYDSYMDRVIFEWITSCREHYSHKSAPASAKAVEHAVDQDVPTAVPVMA